jgi:hypothetical protein
MIYIITAILAALSGLAAWVYKLINENKSLKDLSAQRDAADHIKEWHDRITQQNGVVEEDIRNYEESKKKFHTDWPTDPPSGAV